MATRLPADHGADDPAEGAGRLNHYRLTVLAAGLADAVQIAGGWLFDQARAGWDVNLWAPGHFDPRALAILGVRPLDGDRAEALRDLPDAGALVVSAELLRADPGVRADVLEAARRTGSDLTVLGSWPTEPGGGVHAEEYRFSYAARAFKARALAAVAVTDDLSDTETRYQVRADALRPLYSV